MVLNGIDFSNPLETDSYPRKDYSDGKESARISYKRIWLDHYQGTTEYWSCELKLLSNGKAFLDGKEIRDASEIASVREIFDNLKISP